MRFHVPEQKYREELIGEQQARCRAAALPRCRGDAPALEEKSPGR